MKTLHLCPADHAHETDTLHITTAQVLQMHAETNTINHDIESFLFICVSWTAEQSCRVWREFIWKCTETKGNDMNMNSDTKIDYENHCSDVCFSDIFLLFLPVSLFQVGWSRRHIINIQKFWVWMLCLKECICANLGKRVYVSVAVLHGWDEMSFSFVFSEHISRETMCLTSTECAL